MANLGSHVLNAISKQYRKFEYLSKWPLKLPKNVAAVNLFLANTDSPFHPHPGAKHFLIECIPQLKYSNPGYQIKVQVEGRERSLLCVEQTCGTRYEVDVSDLERDDIKRILEEFSHKVPVS